MGWGPLAVERYLYPGRRRNVKKTCAVANGKPLCRCGDISPFRGDKGKELQEALTEAKLRHGPTLKSQKLNTCGNDMDL